MADPYRENAGSVTFWGLMICVGMAVVVYLLG